MRLSSEKNLRLRRRNLWDKINPYHYKTGGIETIDFYQGQAHGEQFKGATWRGMSLSIFLALSIKPEKKTYKKLAGI